MGAEVPEVVVVVEALVTKYSSVPTFGTQVVGDRDIEGYGQLALRSYEPARHIFRGDFEIGRGDGDFFAVHVQQGFRRCFDRGYLIL
jgi:hypothetical protein